MGKVIFSEIQESIHDLLLNSQSSVCVVVAWFTNKALLKSLTDRLRSSVKVNILLSDHHENSRLNFQEFITVGGEVSVIRSSGNRFLHEKFSIFDQKTVLSGSYNWTYSAEHSNFESVYISTDHLMIRQYLGRYTHLSKMGTRGLDDFQTFSSDSDSMMVQEDHRLAQLEDQLTREIHDSIIAANISGANINAVWIFNFLNQHGAVNASKRLIDLDLHKLRSGLAKLWEIRRLDLSIEHIIIKTNYSALFKTSTLNNARTRLKKLNFPE